MSQRKRIAEVATSSSEEDTSSEEEYVPSSSGRRSVGPAHKKPNKQQSKSQQVDGEIEASGSSQLSTQCSELSKEEFSRCAGLVGNYFLAAECKKIPVRRSDLSKVVGKQHMRRLVPIVEEASALLQKIYAYKVVELQKRKNCYILVNTLAPAINDVTRGVALTADSSEDTEDDRESEDPRLQQEGDERQGLLFTLLTVIFMMGGVVEEVTLLSFLKCVGVYVENKDPHPVFGNCKKVLEDLVRQGFFEVEVLKDMEPPSRQYSWGERAHLQVCKKTVLQFVCKMYGGGMRPENWVDHWCKVVGGGSSSSSTTSSSVGSSVEEIMEVDAAPRTTTSVAGGKRRGRGK